MNVGNVKGTASAYQGSGLETSAEQKTTYEPQVTTSTISTTSEKRAEVGAASEESKEWEIKDTQRNDAVKRAVEEINKKAKNSEAVFGIHDDTNRVTIKIVDKDTKEVIREFPPEETLDMIAKVWELAGLMVDERG